MQGFKNYWPTHLPRLVGEPEKEPEGFKMESVQKTSERFSYHGSLCISCYHQQKWKRVPLHISICLTQTRLCSFPVKQDRQMVSI